MIKRLSAFLLVVVLAFAPAHGDFGAGGQLQGFWAHGGKPTLTFVGSATSASDLTTYTLGSFTQADAGLAVCVWTLRGGTSRTVSSGQIGGVAATLIAGSVTDATQFKAGILYLERAAGSAISCEITLSGANGATPSAQVSFYVITNHNSATPTGSDANQAAGVTSRVATLDFSADGVAVYGTMHRQNDDTVWSAATENPDVFVNTDVRHAAANKQLATAATGDTETATWSTAAGSAITGASWR